LPETGLSQSPFDTSRIHRRITYPEGCGHPVCFWWPRGCKNHGRLEILVSQQLLDRPDVVSHFKQQPFCHCGKRTNWYVFTGVLSAVSCWTGTSMPPVAHTTNSHLEKYAGKSVTVENIRSGEKTKTGTRASSTDHVPFERRYSQGGIAEGFFHNPRFSLLALFSSLFHSEQKGFLQYLP